MLNGSDSLFSTPAMLAAFSVEANLAAMLAFEAGLAQAEARAGVIPLHAAQTIAAACKLELFDAAEIYRKAANSGTPVIPLVKMLTAQTEGEGKKYVHWGATSQDVMDTALMIQSREGLHLLLKDLLAVCSVCADLAERHRHTLMAGRTLLQQALPITFGLKAARWLDLVVRQVEAVQERQVRSLALQLGGAAGTLASLEDKGLEVAALLGEELGLPVPAMPWHAERDRVAQLAATLGIVAGAMSKIGRDLVMLAQTEVGEVQEGKLAGKGGSSAMPQKRNPVDATLALSAAKLAGGTVGVILAGMDQDHERAAGGWQAEWAALPNLFCYTSKAVDGVRSALKDLEVDPNRMLANLDLSRGLVMTESLTVTLARKLGRPAAFKLVEKLVGKVKVSGQELREAAEEDEQILRTLLPHELSQALEPASYLGSTQIFIDRALTAYSKLSAFHSINPESLN